VSLAQLLGLEAPGWQGRIKEAAYTSPSGVRQAFLVTAVSRVTTKRTASFPFADLDDEWVQDNGHGSRRYPLTCIFTGPDHDLLATSFETGLLERGAGELEHPFYGKFPAIPVGDITRRNDLVEDANASIVETTFSTTLANVYPTGLGFPVSELLAQIDGFNLAAAADFSNAVQLANSIQKANVKGTIRALLNEVRSAFDQVSGSVAGARRQLADQQALINEALDVLVGNPILLAQQLVNYIQAPARILSGFASRLEGYGIMLRRILQGFGPTAGDNSSLESVAIAARNTFHVADLFVLGAVSGSVLSVTDQRYRTRPEALSATDTIIGQLSSAVEWRDDRAETLDQIDTGAAYQALQEAVAQASGYLVETSFSLIPERAIVVARARTLLDLCAELYGDVSDERLDFLIDSNNLGGDEILEIQRGRRIVYYV
jgi:hypothetical protein